MIRRPSGDTLTRPKKATNRRSLLAAARRNQAALLDGTPMSAPLPISCAENRDYTERKKERAKNISVLCPSEDCAEHHRAASKARSRDLASIPAPKGQRPGCPFLARIDGLEPLNQFPHERDGRPSFWKRPSRALPDREGSRRRAMPSRPSQAGRVNDLVKYADKPSKHRSRYIASRTRSAQRDPSASRRCLPAQACRHGGTPSPRSPA
jgi:hypothetical protein